MSAFVEGAAGVTIDPSICVYEVYDIKHIMTICMLLFPSHFTVHIY